MPNDAVIVRYITFNPVEVNGVVTFDNLFIALDPEDKIGAGMVFPVVQQTEGGSPINV
jgi:hypothetical protein